MEKGTIYIFIIAFLMGWLGMSFIAHYNSKHGDRNQDYTFSSSEGFIHHPLVGDVYTLRDTTNNVFTYFKIIWVGKDGEASVVNGKDTISGSPNSNWITKAMNSSKPFSDEVITLNPIFIDQNSLEEGKKIMIHRLNLPLELSVLDKILSSPIGFLLSVLLAFLIIMFGTSTEIFVGKFAGSFPRFGNILLVCFWFAYLFNNPVFFPSIGVAGIFSILTIIPTYLLFQKYKSKIKIKAVFKSFFTVELSKIVFIILFGVLFQIVALLITVTIQWQFNINSENLYIHLGDLFSKSFFQTNAVLLWSCIAIGNMLNNVRYYLANLQNKEKELAYTKQKELQSQAELDALQARVNPHFLYNSLNSIAGLAQEDPAKTEEMAIALSHFFKYSTNRRTENWSTIEKEIEILETYLEIEKIRFGERLQFQLTCPDELLTTKTPRFLLQPIVENAIKYGYDQATNSIAIQINIHQTTNQLIFQIYDGGKPFPDNMPSGYGLQSIRKKLALFFPEKHELAFINEPKKHVVITLFL